jgi:hypothetical protein
MFLLFALGFFQLSGRRGAGRFTNEFAAGGNTVDNMSDVSQ